ncbi:MAG: type IV pilus modification protein PilV [Pseudomonadota bacterium]
MHINIMRTMRRRGRTRARGFSMIELLVAVLVMGIGVLGITGLQMVSLQNNRGALLRSEAVMLAYDMLDRIRANPTGVPAGASYGGTAIGDAPPGGTNCQANNCSSAEMVQFDLSVWKCALGSYLENGVCTAFHGNGVLPPPTEQPGLPNGDGSIAVNGVSGVVTVTVRWSDPNLGQREIVVESQG